MKKPNLIALGENHFRYFHQITDGRRAACDVFVAQVGGNDQVLRYRYLELTPQPDGSFAEVEYISTHSHGEAMQAWEQTPLETRGPRPKVTTESDLYPLFGQLSNTRQQFMHLFWIPTGSVAAVEPPTYTPQPYGVAAEDDETDEGDEDEG